MGIRLSSCKRQAWWCSDGRETQIGRQPPQIDTSCHLLHQSRPKPTPIPQIDTNINQKHSPKSTSTQTRNTPQIDTNPDLKSKTRFPDSKRLPKIGLDLGQMEDKLDIEWPTQMALFRSEQVKSKLNCIILGFARIKSLSSKNFDRLWLLTVWSLCKNCNLD